MRAETGNLVVFFVGAKAVFMQRITNLLRKTKLWLIWFWKTKDYTSSFRTIHSQIVGINLKRTAQITILFVALIGCKEQNSMVFQDCECNKLDLSHAELISDTLNLFKVPLPDSSWKPYKNIFNGQSVIVMGDTISNGLSLVSVSANSFTPPWNSTEEIENMKKSTDYISYGSLVTSDKLFDWFYIKEKPSNEFKYSLHLVHPDTNRNVLYSITLCTTEENDNQKRLCELEDFIRRFEKIKN